MTQNDLKYVLIVLEYYKPIEKDNEIISKIDIFNRLVATITYLLQGKAKAF